MHTYLIKNARIVNEGTQFYGEVLIKNGRIEKIASQIDVHENCIEIDANGKMLMPGIIDDQVHFREPGLTHKATIYSEAKAGIAGGVTTFMEMPNTNPPATTQDLLQQKYDIAATTSLANYSFYMGVSNDNYEEVMRTNGADVCGLKIFMGSSTGNMLVDNEETLNRVFANTPLVISTHCESEQIIRANTEKAKAIYGEQIPIQQHPIIRNEEACLASSSIAVALAKKYGTRLNVFHISTADEIQLFESSVDRNASTAEVLKALASKNITSEICVHHLHFDASQYDTLGALIKCNPAIKAAHHKKALFEAMLDNKLDLIATDHAPHTWEEKQLPGLAAPSGLPLLQHSLNMMLGFYKEGRISLEKIVEKMCHAPATIFRVKDRGFIREGYAADLVLVDLDATYQVTKENILYKCGWSPLEGNTLQGKITHTFVNGHLVFENGKFDECMNGMRLTFNQ